MSDLYLPTLAFLIQLIHAGVGFALIWYAVIWMNRSTGTEVKDVLKTIYSDPLAAAVYRGSVMVSVFLYFSQFVR